MPAKNPVIAVVVPKHVAATIKRLAGIRGVSRSSVVRDFLIETQPVLERIANLLDLAARTDREALKEWAKTLEHAQGSLEFDATRAMATLEHAQQSLSLKKPGRPPAGTRTERPSRAHGRARARKVKPHA